QLSLVYEEANSEGLIANGSEDLFPLSRSQHPVAASGRGLLHRTDGAGRDEPLPFGPVEGTFHARDPAATAAVAPARMEIEPAVYVERLQISDRQPPVVVAEILEKVLVPLVGAGLMVALAEVEVEIADGGDGELGRGRDLAALFGHQPAECPIS